MRVLPLLCCALAAAASAQTRSPAPLVTEVLATQIALDRAGFSPGEIDGRAGRNLQRAREAYERSHEGPVALLGDVPPLVEYTLTEADVAGAFTPDIPPNLPDQAALDALNYRNPLEAIAERFHSSPGLLRQLNPQASFERAGERIFVPNIAAPMTLEASPAAPASSVPTVTVIVTKSTSALTVEDASGQVLFHAPVTSGSTHDPLPIGTWTVKGVQRNPTFHYNPQLFWDATPGDRKATLQPGPNNPVGLVWIDLSKPHYGIHGTPEPAKIGHVESHGCVRLTNWDALRVAQFVKPGTKVVFRE